MDNKCNLNYKSQYAFVDNKCYNIDEYINLFSNTKIIPKCGKGHELLVANGKINKPHFRHKNSNDIGGFPMTEWHCEWQSNFSNVEVNFSKLNDLQISDRRADVLLQEYNIVIEFQHSKIDYDEVLNRKNDYELNNKKTIWIINGNNTITIKNIDYCNRVFLEFISDNWKYKSFICYDYIFIDINGLIYKISPKHVKGNMIDVEQPIVKDEFIKLLISNNSIINNIDIPLQCNLYIKQQGAGNGKTYGLIQMLESEEFEHYKCFIIVTKQHSAKYVIYKEFTDQIKKGYLQYLHIIDEKHENNKYTISYKNNKTDSICQLIVGTIDSLIYILGNKNNKELNKFEGLVNSIVSGYIEENNIKSINYGNVNIKLNKEICLICDETQDLTVYYGEAIVKIMRNKYIDSYIVGDKLQSLAYKENAFTYLMDNEFEYINKIEFEKTNICRRFYHPQLVHFVNNIVSFDKYQLPEILPYKMNQNNDKVVSFFTGIDYNIIVKNELKLNEEVENIIYYYNKEVIDNNYNPNDFLFITPFTNFNPLVNAVEIAINMYWKKKYNNLHFERYAIFHKSEEGTSINLSESENSTRLVSIHTSKGDGRNVVFVIGLNEQSLIRFSNENNNLIYDSLIHVAFTRMKKKIYISVEENNDDIHQKISKYICDNDIISELKPDLYIRKKIKYNDIIDCTKTKIDFELLSNIIIKDNNKLQFNEDDNKLIIDMGHHNIRYSSMLIYLYIKIIKSQNNLKNTEIKKQITAKFNEIKNAKIYDVDNWQQYNQYLENNNNSDFKYKKIVLLKLSNNGDYNMYHGIILDFINDIKCKMIEILNNKIDTLCPFESIILYYMIQTCKNGKYTEITINDLYNILDIYYHSFNDNIKGHDKCLCKKHFHKNQSKKENKKIKDMQEYLLTHYENIDKIGKVYDIFLIIFPSVNWLIDHFITFNGNNNDYNIYKKYAFIGYDDQNVYNIYIKPNLSDLNYNQILIDSIFDSYLISNVKNYKKDDDFEDDEQRKSILNNYKRFNNKNIKTVIFTLNMNNYIILDWKIDNENLIIKHSNLILGKIKEKIINKYNIESKCVYYLYKYYKNELNINTLTSEEIIENIINKFKNYKFIDKIPSFILEFLHKIETKIECYDDETDKQIIINKYNNKDYFLNELEKLMIKSIHNFLGIKNK